MKERPLFLVVVVAFGGGPPKLSRLKLLTATTCREGAQGAQGGLLCSFADTKANFVSKRAIGGLTIYFTLPHAMSLMLAFFKKKEKLAIAA